MKNGRWSALLCSSALLLPPLLLPVAAAARAELAATTDPEPAPSLERGPGTAAAPAQAKGGYRIQCWQHGRLLFEETHVTLPSHDTRFALKLTGHDGNGRPLYVAETSNATCVVRYDRTVLNPALPR